MGQTCFRARQPPTFPRLAQNGLELRPPRRNIARNCRSGCGSTTAGRAGRAWRLCLRGPSLRPRSRVSTEQPGAAPRVPSDFTRQPPRVGRSGAHLLIPGARGSRTGPRVRQVTLGVTVLRVSGQLREGGLTVNKLTTQLLAVYCSG